MPRTSKIHSVIYVPGLGDSRVSGQRLAVSKWRWQGVEPYLLQMNWGDKSDFKPKLNRLLRLIDRLADEGKDVSLVGASAGASAVLNAYALRQNRIRSVACICGKIQNPQGVSEYTYRQNPAFRESMEQLPQSLEALEMDKRARILSLHPLKDMSVPVPDTFMTGAESGKMPVAGHAVGIAYGLTLGSRRLLRFLKKAPAVK